MKILIKNANLISMSDKREKIESNIDILIEDKKISKIAKKIDDVNADKIIDATGKYVMPGLINTHSHIGMSIFRETVDGYKTQDWLSEKIWPMEDKLTKDDMYWTSKLSCLEMIKTGTTMVNDMYFMQDETIKAAIESGIRLQVTRTLMDADGKGETKLQEFEKMIEENSTINQNNNGFESKESDLITFNAGIHGFYTASPNYIEKCMELIKKYNLPIHIHFCENQQEREDIIKLQNVSSPLDAIEKYFKGYHVILAHSVKLSDEEIKRLSNYDVYVSHCPVSNLKLGCGVANIAKMQDEGICVSLGTDGQGSGSSLDLFEQMKFAALLQKGVLENPVLEPAYEILKMATINGAKALNVADKIGTIEEGKYADLIILNLSEILTMPQNNIFAEIVYNAKGYNVETTIVNGKVLMENRNVNNFDEKNIVKKCEEIINRIK